MTEDEVVTKAMKRKKKKQKILSKNLLSTGSTLLNLACTGRVNGGFLKGGFYWIVGRSSSGKSFLSLTCLAEALRNENFEDYRVIYDDAENGALMDMEKFFGSKLQKAIEPPAGTREEPEFSRTTEDFFDNLHRAFKEGPFIYVLDSMDILNSRADLKKRAKMRNARAKGTEEKGDMGMNKPKVNSQEIREVIQKLRDTKSILIVISQTRDNSGFGAMFEPDKPSGGRALKYYATLEIWAYVKQLMQRMVNKKKRAIGTLSKIRVRKNRVAGKDRVIYVPIYYSHGIADTDSMVRFLIDEGRWKGKVDGKNVSAPDFNFTGSKEKLIQKIEQEELESELKSLTKETWDSIEQDCEVIRKKKYE